MSVCVISLYSNRCILKYTVDQRDERNFFPIIRKRIRCNIIESDDEWNINLWKKYVFYFPQHVIFFFACILNKMLLPNAVLYLKLLSLLLAYSQFDTSFVLCCKSIVSRLVLHDIFYTVRAHGVQRNWYTGILYITFLLLNILACKYK